MIGLLKYFRLLFLFPLLILPTITLADDCASSAYISTAVDGRSSGCNHVQHVMRDDVTSAIFLSCGEDGVFYQLITTSPYVNPYQALHTEQCPFAASVHRHSANDPLMISCGDRAVIFHQFPVRVLTDQAVFGVAYDNINRVAFVIQGGVYLVNSTAAKKEVISFDVCTEPTSVFSNAEWDGNIYTLCSADTTIVLSISSRDEYVGIQTVFNSDACMNPQMITGAEGALFISCTTSTTTVFALYNGLTMPILNSTSCIPANLFAVSRTSLYAVCSTADTATTAVAASVIRIDFNLTTSNVVITPVVSADDIASPLAVTVDTLGNMFVFDATTVYQVSQDGGGVVAIHYFGLSGTSSFAMYRHPSSQLLYVSNDAIGLVTLNLTTINGGSSGPQTIVTVSTILSQQQVKVQGTYPFQWLINSEGHVYASTNTGLLYVDGTGLSSYHSALPNCTVIATLEYEARTDQIMAACRQNGAFIAIGNSTSSYLPMPVSSSPCSTIGSATRDPVSGQTYFACETGSSALAVLSADWTSLTTIAGPPNCMPAYGVQYANGTVFFTCGGGNDAVMGMPLLAATADGTNSSSTAATALSLATANQCANARSAFFHPGSDFIYIGCPEAQINVKSLDHIVRTGLATNGECDSAMAVVSIGAPGEPNVLAMCPYNGLITIRDNAITPLVGLAQCAINVTKGVGSFAANANLIAYPCGSFQLLLIQTSMGVPSSQQFVNIACDRPLSLTIASDNSTWYTCTMSPAPLFRILPNSNSTSSGSSSGVNVNRIDTSVPCFQPSGFVFDESKQVFYFFCNADLDYAVVAYDLRSNSSTILLHQTDCLNPGTLTFHGDSLFVVCLPQTILSFNLASGVIQKIANCYGPRNLLVAVTARTNSLFITCANPSVSAILAYGLDSHLVTSVVTAMGCLNPNKLGFDASTDLLYGTCDQGVLAISTQYRCYPSSYWRRGQCVACPIYTYRNYSQLSTFGTCFDCPPGSVTASTGSTSCTTCDVGFYESSNKCLLCAPGKYQNQTGQTTCQNCPKGYSSLSAAATSCDPCPIGFYSNIPGTATCLACNPGRFSNFTGRAEECDVCPPGKYQGGVGKTVCQQCEAQSYSEKPESTSCTRCEARVNAARTVCDTSACGKNTQYNSLTSNCDGCLLGQYSPIGGRCTDCSLHSYTPYAGSDCISCQLSGMDGLYCSGGLASVKEGYWAFQTNVSVLTTDGPQWYMLYQTVSCPLDTCPGSPLQISPFSNGGTSNTTMNVTTTIEYCTFPRLNDPSNLLCASCVDGYLPWNNKCVPCEKPDGGLWAAALILSFCLAIFLLQSSGSAAGPLSVFLFFIQTCALEIGPISKSISWIQLLNFDTKSTSACMAPWSPPQQTLFSLFVPIILLAELGVILILHYCLFKWLRNSAPISASSSSPSSAPSANDRNSASGSMLDSMRKGLVATIHGFSINTYVAGAMSILLFCYTQVATACVSYLYCVQVADEYLLFSAPTVNCHSSEYKTYLVPVILALIVYVIAFPIIVVVLLWLHKDSLFLSPADAARIASSSSVQSFLIRYSPLYRMYQPKAWWWQPVVLVRRAVFVVVSAVLIQQAAVRFFVYNLLHFISLLIHAALQPFESLTLNRLETVSYVFLIILSALLTGYLPPYQLGVQVVIFLLIIPAAIVLFGFVVHERFERFHKQSIDAQADIAKQQQSPNLDKEEVELPSIGGPDAVQLGIEEDGHVQAGNGTSANIMPDFVRSDQETL